MSEEKLVCKVQWLKLWKSLSIYGATAIVVAITIGLFAALLKSGFDFGSTFGHLTSWKFILILPALCIALSVFMFPIAILVSLGKITIAGGSIEGRNYWMRKRRIPLDDITKLSLFNSNGIKAIVVHSKSNGTIHISYFTENLEELIDLVSMNLDAKNNT